MNFPQKLFLGFNILAVAVFSYLAYVQKNAIKEQKLEIANKQATIDSLYWENFHLSNEVDRYNMALDHLQEVNSGAATDFQNYLDNETE